MKINIILVLFLAIFLTFTQAFANPIDNEENPGTVLSAQSGAVDFNFSPGVAGLYGTVATTANEQWYVISTYHQGGRSFYGSTSDSSSIYKQSREANQLFATLTFPEEPLKVITEAVIVDGVVTEPAVTESADEVWLGNGWTK